MRRSLPRLSNNGDRAGAATTRRENLGTDQTMTRIEQRGAVAFTGPGMAAAVILLITLWGYVF